MTEKNPFSAFLSNPEFSNFFKELQGSPADFKTLLETQRRNVQAMTEAQQIAIENFRNLVERQSEIISQTIADNSTLAKGFISEGTPEEKMAKNAKLFKTAYERSIKNLRELSAMTQKANEEASNIINKRVSASMNEIQSSLEKTDKKDAA